MDPTIVLCNLICPKGQPPSSVLVPGRDRRDGSMEGRPGSKGSTERGHFASKGDPFGWGVGWVTGWKPSEGIGWLNGGFEVCFCFFFVCGLNSQGFYRFFTAFLLMNIFLEDSKVWILDDICLWIHLCAGNPCETLMPVDQERQRRARTLKRLYKSNWKFWSLNCYRPGGNIYIIYYI